MNHEIQAEVVFSQMVALHLPEERAAVVDGLREIWASVAADLRPDEAIAVLWSVAPHAFVVGSGQHAARRNAVAAVLYPGEDRAKAAVRFRRLLQSPAVLAVVSALRAEESIHLLGERAKAREVLWSIATSPPPPGSEPKDVNAHNVNRIRALDSVREMDRLDVPPPAAGPSQDADGPRKKVLDKLRRLLPSSR